MALVVRSRRRWSIVIPWHPFDSVGRGCTGGVQALSGSPRSGLAIPRGIVPGRDGGQPRILAAGEWRAQAPA